MYRLNCGFIAARNAQISPNVHCSAASYSSICIRNVITPRSTSTCSGRSNKPGALSDPGRLGVARWRAAGVTWVVLTRPGREGGGEVGERVRGVGGGKVADAWQYDRERERPRKDWGKSWLDVWTPVMSQSFSFRCYCDMWICEYSIIFLGFFSLFCCHLFWSRCSF